MGMGMCMSMGMGTGMGRGAGARASEVRGLASWLLRCEAWALV